MAAAESPNQNYLAELHADAFNWLNVVGEYDHVIFKPDTEYNRANSAVVKYLGDRMAENSYDTAYLLATLDREALLHTSESESISDEEAQNNVRAKQFYVLARTLGSFASSTLSKFQYKL